MLSSDSMYKVAQEDDISYPGVGASLVAEEVNRAPGTAPGGAGQPAAGEQPAEQPNAPADAAGAAAGQPAAPEKQPAAGQAADAAPEKQPAAGQPAAPDTAPGGAGQPAAGEQLAAPGTAPGGAGQPNAPEKQPLPGTVKSWNNASDYWRQVVAGYLEGAGNMFTTYMSLRSKFRPYSLRPLTLSTYGMVNMLPLVSASDYQLMADSYLQYRQNKKGAEARNLAGGAQGIANQPAPAVAAQSIANPPAPAVAAQGIANQPGAAVAEAKEAPPPAPA